MKRSKRFLSLLLAVALCIACLPAGALRISAEEQSFAGGSGIEGDPYLIATKEQLNNVRNDLDAHYKMTADIVFTDADFAQGGDFYNGGAGWVPIGDRSTYFTGIFDGNGHTVSGLTISISSNSYVYAGLFGCVFNGTIMNLGVEDCAVSVTWKDANAFLDVCAGAVAGCVSGGKVIDCYSTGSVTAEESDYAQVGGIVGYLSSNGAVRNCFHTGSVIADTKTVTDYSNAYAHGGGIVGLAKGTVSNCSNTGDVKVSSETGRNTSNAYAYAGGITGSIREESVVSCCWNAGSVMAYATDISIDRGAYAYSYAGGVAGTVNASLVSSCYNAGDVDASSNAWRSSSYAYARSGGIAGRLIAGSAIGCYNTGAVTAAATSFPYRAYAYPGGVAGDIYNNASITNCYYLNNTEKSLGEGTETAFKCTSAQMKQQTTFEGFDFDTVWTMEGNVDYPYPELQAAGMEYTKILESIKITTLPAKRDYTEGEPLDLTGGRITLYYAGGVQEERDITPEMVTGFDPAAVARQTLTVSCGEMTDTFTVEVHKYLFDLSGANLRLGEDITMYFYIPTANLEGENYYVSIFRNGEDGDYITVPYTQWEPYSDTLMRVAYPNIAACQMVDNISVTVYDDDGTAVSHTWRDSVRNYCMRMLSNENTTSLEKTVMVDLLNYGWAAQSFFDYNISNNATFLLSSEQLAMASPLPTLTDNSVKGANNVGSSLVLRNKILLTLYFENIDPSMHAVVTYYDYYGTLQTIQVAGSDFVDYGSYYGIRVDTLVMAEYQKLVTVKVYNSANQLVASASDSVESYLSRQQNDSYLYPEIAKALSSALAYANSKT